MNEEQKSELYKKVEKFVRDSFTANGKTSSTFDHQVETAELVKKLKPDADEALLIAAVSHDIERATRKQDMYDLLKSTDDGFKNEKFLEMHQSRGSEIIGEFLKKKGARHELINKVERLVSSHELGGDKESNNLKDADSLSFFNTRAIHFVNTKIEQSSSKKIKLKLDWMYNRITAPEVRKMVESNYLEAIKELENV